MTADQEAALVNKVAEALRGQCLKGVDDVLEDLGVSEEPSQHFYWGLDQQVFCCDRCSWWCEVSEMSDACADASTWWCDDCADEDDCDCDCDCD